MAVLYSLFSDWQIAIKTDNKSTPINGLQANIDAGRGVATNSEAYWFRNGFRGRTLFQQIFIFCRILWWLRLPLLLIVAIITIIFVVALLVVRHFILASNLHKLIHFPEIKVFPFSQQKEDNKITELRPLCSAIEK